MDQQFVGGEWEYDDKNYRSLGWFMADADGTVTIQLVAADKLGLTIAGKVLVSNAFEIGAAEEGTIEFDNQFGKIGRPEFGQSRFAVADHTSSNSDFILRNKYGGHSVFNSRGYEIASFDSNGNQTRYYYSDIDGDGKSDELINIVNQGGLTTTLNYRNGYLTTISDHVGRTTAYSVQGGELRSVVQPDTGYKQSLRPELKILRL